LAALTIDIIGIPIPQGSLVANGYGRGLRHSNQDKLRPWRAQLIAELVAARPISWDPSLPISVTATFRFPRPQGHYGTGRNSNTLKPSAPTHHIVKPDLDKAQRALGDAIEQSGLARGDQQITGWNVAKRYALPDESPGALITITPL